MYKCTSSVLAANRTLETKGYHRSLKRGRTCKSRGNRIGLRRTETNNNKVFSDEGRNDRPKRRGIGVLDNNKKNREETGLQKNSQAVVADEAEVEERGSKREGAANSSSLQSARLGRWSEKAATRRFSGGLFLGEEGRPCERRDEDRVASAEYDAPMK